MTYKEQLLDPRWQKKRLEILTRDNFACEYCKAEDITLHVHHRYYVSGRLPWEYPPFCFQTLCKDCHENIKTGIEESRDEDGYVIPTEWEFGLNHFGDAIFDMAVNAIDQKNGLSVP